MSSEGRTVSCPADSTLLAPLTNEQSSRDLHQLTFPKYVNISSFILVFTCLYEDSLDRTDSWECFS